jgi:hypothetical protein
MCGNLGFPVTVSEVPKKKRNHIKRSSDNSLALTFVSEGDVKGAISATN